MNAAKSSIIEKRKQAWLDFYDRKPSPKHVFIINYWPDIKPAPKPWPEFKKERMEYIYDKCCRHMERIEWLQDDSLPFLEMISGTEIFAEAFGCKVHRPQDNNPFALPLIKSPSEVSALKVPELGSSTLAIHFEIADELIARTGKGTLLRPPDIQSPMDIASLIWDKNTFYMALIDAPEAVRELAHKVKTLLTAFLDEWFSRYGREFMAHHPDYYMPYGITLSEDEIGIVNQDMFNEFYLQELVELSERYGAIGIHCCANARHQWENLKKIPNLKLLNLNNSLDYIKEAYEFFAEHTAQMHWWCGDGEPETWASQLPEKARAVITAQADTKEKALRIADALRRTCS